MSLESKFKMKVVDYLTKDLKLIAHCLVVASKSGEPDICGCLPDGRYYAIETKQEKEQARKLQEYKLNRIRESGGIAFVLPECKDWKEKIKNNLRID